MTTQQIKDNVQQQTKTNKGVNVMNDKQKQQAYTIKRIAYDITNRIAFNIKTLKQKQSYLSMKNPEHTQYVTQEIKSLSKEDKQTLIKAYNIIDRLSNEIGTTLRDNYIQTLRQQPNKSIAEVRKEQSKVPAKLDEADKIAAKVANRAAIEDDYNI